jgi:hypothetical protein
MGRMNAKPDGSFPPGRADIHGHPLEPSMARLTIAKRFGA